MRIREFGRVVTGTTPPSSKREQFGDLYPFITPSDLGFDTKSPRTARRLSSLGAAANQRRELPPGSVAFTCIGATIGKCCFISETSFSNQQINTIVVDQSKFSPDYIYYLLRHEAESIKSQASGAATPIISKSAFENIAVTSPVPSLAMQRRIGEILSAYDELIENNTRRIKILEEMAQSIYKEWFVNFRYPGHENVPLVDSELGPIPEGWDLRVLNELVISQYGYTESTSVTPVGPKFLRGMDINKTSYIDWDAVPYCPIDDKDLLKFRLAHGDVLIIRMADPGKVGIVERDVEAVFASYLVRLRPVDSNYLDPYFLFYYANSDSYQGFITGASTGTTRKSISARVMTSPSLVTPPPPVQLEFRSTVEPIRKLMGNLVQANVTLRETRDLLLPRLVSGEIDVSGLDVAGVPSVDWGGPPW